jgi:hypothetical protein
MVISKATSPFRHLPESFLADDGKTKKDPLTYCIKTGHSPLQYLVFVQAPI